jgi:hypothetical protein
MHITEGRQGVVARRQHCTTRMQTPATASAEDEAGNEEHE